MLQNIWTRIRNVLFVSSTTSCHLKFFINECPEQCSCRSCKSTFVIGLWNIIQLSFGLYKKLLIGMFDRSGCCGGVKGFASGVKSVMLNSLRVLAKGKGNGLAAIKNLAFAFGFGKILNDSREPVNGICEVLKYQMGSDENSKLFLIRDQQIL